MTEINLASAWEAIAERTGDRPALVHGDDVVTWSGFDDRAGRLASAFAAVGIGAGDNVAIALFNCNEYLESEYAAFKVRAAPCNVNYRYVERELSYLVDNSDAKAVVFDATLADRFDAIRADLPGVRLWVQVGATPRADWAVGYEQLLATHDPCPAIDRSPGDLWILYTGGTTGNPKGVMWPHRHLVTLSARHFDGLDVEFPTGVADIADMLEQLDRVDGRPVQLAASPLMHGTAGIAALMHLFMGGTVVTLTGRSFDAVELWRTVERRRCTGVSIVGDVFCRPMVDALDEAAAAGSPIDLSSVRTVTSSGVMWSQPVKDRLLAHGRRSGAELACNDSLGASEGIGFGRKLSRVGGSDTTTARFELGPNAAVFAEDGTRIRPGSGERGLLAVGGPIPVGYYGDPEKTAETFRLVEGRRWSMPGDWAEIEADGTIVLIGRGSVSINTGGEKVYPEEVEEALKLLDAVEDANVVGVPDPVWGSAVTAVVELTPGAIVSDDELVAALRLQLAGYKCPKHIVRVDALHRHANGKSDYRWAIHIATEALSRT